MNKQEMRIEELELENSKLKDWCFMLENTLEQHFDIIKFLRAEKAELENKLMVYQEHCIIKKEEDSLEILDKLSEATKKAQKAFKGEEFIGFDD